MNPKWTQCLVHGIVSATQKNKDDSFDLNEYFQSLPKKQHGQVWTALLVVTETAVDSLSQTIEEDKVGEILGCSLPPPPLMLVSRRQTSQDH